MNLPLDTHTLSYILTLTRHKSINEEFKERSNILTVLVKITLRCVGLGACRGCIILMLKQAALKLESVVSGISLSRSGFESWSVSDREVSLVLRDENPSPMKSSLASKGNTFLGFWFHCAVSLLSTWSMAASCYIYKRIV